MGMKARVRKGRTKIIWKGKAASTAGEAIRVIAVDLPSNDPIPYQVTLQIQRGVTKSWHDSGVGMTWLEKQLVLELADKLGTLPVWPHG